MSFPVNFIYGDDANLGYWAQILYVAFAVISFLLFFVQMLFLQQLRLVPVVLLPLLSFCITYENAVMYYSCVSPTLGADVIGTAHVANALVAPLFVVILYEICFGLHEARSAHFFCFPMEQGDDISNAPALTSVWLLRCVAAGLFVMSILVNFSIVEHGLAPKTGSGGFAYLAKHADSLSIWLSLIPPIAVSFMALITSIAIHRYGKYHSLGLVNRWRYFSFFGLAVIVGYCFSYNVYPVTSNAGELTLLLGLTGLVWFVQAELFMAGTFADFLHRSNLAFTPLQKNVVSALDVIEREMAPPRGSVGSSGVLLEREMLDVSSRLGAILQQDLLQEGGVATPSFPASVPPPVDDVESSRPGI